MNILAFETSCDDTSVAVLNNDNIISCITYNQSNEHAKYNGIYPQLAIDLHYKNIIDVTKKALYESKIDINDIDAICYTKKPGLKSSLLIGETVATTLSFLLDTKLYPINHLDGHIDICHHKKKVIYPAITLIISGGHTSIYLLIDKNTRKLMFESNDDAIGEALDKIGIFLNLQYPAGKEIDKRSILGNFDSKYIFKYYHVKENLNILSYSGFKTDVIQKIQNYKKNININNVCYMIMYYALKQLDEAIQIILIKYKIKSLLIGGGVSASKFIRNIWIKKYNNLVSYFPEIKYSTDNAAMIGISFYNNLK